MCIYIDIHLLFAYNAVPFHLACWKYLFIGTRKACMHQRAWKLFIHKYYAFMSHSFIITMMRSEKNNSIEKIK